MCGLLFCCWLFGQVTAQTVYHQEWNTSKGLPTDCVYDLAQDAEGFMYLGTDQGVYVFNGFRFSQIPLRNSVSNSLTSLGFSADHTLWCRNFSDQVFFQKEGTLQPFRLAEKQLKNDILIDLKVRGDQVYIAGFQSLMLYSNARKTAQKKWNISGIESLEWKQDVLVVTTVSGSVYGIRNGKIEFEHRLPTGKYRLAAGKGLKAIEKNQSNGSIWNLDGQKPFRGSGPSFPVGTLVNTAHLLDDLIYICTNQGTFFETKTGWKQFSTGQNHTDFLVDFQGGSWISTIENGLIYIPSWQTSYFVSNPDQLAYKHMIPSPKGYFLSTNRGRVDEVDARGKRVQIFRTTAGAEQEFIHFSKQQRRLYTSFGSFSYDRPGEFHAFYFGKGIAFDPQQNLFFGIHSLSACIPYRQPFPLQKWTRQTLHSEGVTFFPLRFKRTRDLCYIGNTLYVAYVDKVVAYSPTAVREITDNGKPIHAVRFATDRKGRVWIATTQQGVYCFNPVGNALKHWTKEAGLSHNQCKQIRILGEQAYVITISGADRIHPDQEKVQSLCVDFSLENLSISDVLKVADTLFFVTNKGVVRVEEHNEGRPFSAPRIYLRSVTTPLKTYEIQKNQFDFAENTLELQWDYVAFREQARLPLYYRLKGFDDRWKSINATVGSLVYNNLSHGVYTFEIRSSGDAARVVSYTFAILRPFWWTWWFLSLAVLIVLAVGYLVVKVTVRTVKRKQHVKELLILSQLKAIRSQMNPHFLYNALNSLQGLIYSRKVDEAGTFVSMFSDHLRYTLSMSEKQFVSVRDELESLSIYLELEKLRFGDDFQYTIEKHPSVSDRILIPSMIIQPYVENAVKHGLLNKRGEKKVSVVFSELNPNSIQVSIVDNGIGREHASRLNLQRKDKPKSFATEAINNRIELLNQQYKDPISLQIVDLISNGISAGTAVYIQIPTTFETDESSDRRR